MLMKSSSYIALIIISMLIAGCTVKQPVQQIKYKEVDASAHTPNAMELEEKRFNAFLNDEFDFEHKRDATKKEQVQKDIYYYILQKQGIIQ